MVGRSCDAGAKRRLTLASRWQADMQLDPASPAHPCADAAEQPGQVFTPLNGYLCRNKSEKLVSLCVFRYIKGSGLQK